MSEAQQPPEPRPWYRLRGEVALSLAATALSLCAVVTTIWQTAIMREQLRASVWPRLQLDLHYHTEDNLRFFRILLDNVGVGPAIVTGVRISYRGEAVGSLTEVLQKVLAEHRMTSAELSQFDHNDIRPDLVLPQQKGLVLLLAKGRPGKEPTTTDLFRAAAPHLQIAIQYASIYGEVWEVGYPDRRLRRIGWRDTP